MIDPSWSVLLSLSILYVVNFITLNKYVYVSKGGHGRKMLLYLGVSALFRVSEYLVFEVIYKLFDVFYLVAFVIAIGLSFVIKYSVYKYVVFGVEIEGSDGNK